MIYVQVLASEKKYKQATSPGETFKLDSEMNRAGRWARLSLGLSVITRVNE